MKTTILLLMALLAALCLAGCFTPLDKEGMVYVPPAETEQPSKPAPEEDPDAFAAAIRPVPVLILETNGRRFAASFEDNSSAEALCERLSREPLELKLLELGTRHRLDLAVVVFLVVRKVLLRHSIILLDCVP